MPDIEELKDRLDSLWATYLEQLDAYEQAQKAIQKHFSKGFFELALANRRVSGRRIGQDWYDERCRATSRVSIRSAEEPHDEDAVRPAYDIAIINVPQYVKHPANDEKQEEQQLPTPSATPERELDDEELKDGDEGAKLQKDPITWFGLFASANLRATQSEFRSALYDTVQPTEVVGDQSTETVEKVKEVSEVPMSKAINASRALRLIEIEIRRNRKAIKAAMRSVNAG